MRKLKALNQKGLTLLEVLVSMIVLSLGLLSLAPMVVLSIEGNNISRDAITVSSLAKERIEYYRAQDSLPTIPYSSYEYDLRGGYDRQTYITDSTIDTLVPGGLARVDVTIIWVDNSNVNRSTSYTTFLEK